MEFKTYQYEGLGRESSEDNEFLRKVGGVDDLKKLRKLKSFFDAMSAAGELPYAMAGVYEVDEKRRIRMIYMSYPEHIKPPSRQRYFGMTEELYAFLKVHDAGVLDILIAEMERRANAGNEVSCGEVIKEWSCSKKRRI